MTHYEVLRVQKNASQRQIESAYRIRAAETHPDTNPAPTAADEFKRVKAAYDVLGDPTRRRAYDTELNRGARTGQAQQPSQDRPETVRRGSGVSRAVVLAALIAGAGVVFLVGGALRSEPGVASSAGSCPADHPVKGNLASSGERIYHVATGQFYRQTRAERCFADGREAEAAGFRASQR